MAPAARNGGSRCSVAPSRGAPARTAIVPDRTVGGGFARRAARAETLASSSAAPEPLLYAAGLYRAQGRAAAGVEASHRHSPMSGRLEQDLARLAGGLDDLLRFAADHGPPVLAEDARRCAAGGAPVDRLVSWWTGGGAGEDYLSRALLRPYAEVLARLRLPPDRPRRPGRCPFCGGAPWIAARRPVPQTDGAQRTLECGLCSGEWPLARVHCAACPEEDPAKLPSYQTEAHPAVRIEACETCRRYVKSIDLGLDARAIPEVDDLVSLSVDLWALEQGFTRVEPGLAGV